LGFKVDNASFNKMQDTLKNLSENVKDKTSGMATNYAVASGVIVSSLASVATATVDLLDKISQADLGYQKFALRMYMARDAAKQFKIVTDSMGESMSDIAWIPELNERYRTLMGEAGRMETPKDAGAQLRYLRDIRFEFTRLKVEATYGLQWIGYYLFKYLQGPIFGTKGTLKDLNDWIQARMPEWTERIANFLSKVYKLVTDVLAPVKYLYEIFKGLFEEMPAWGKALAELGAIFLALFVVGPVGRAILTITALNLLLQDFFSYVNGEKSNKDLAPVWQELLNMIGGLNRSLMATLILIDKMFAKGKGGEPGWHAMIGRLLKGEWVLGDLDLVKEVDEMNEQMDKDYPGR
jgi:hypothetical protein